MLFYLRRVPAIGHADQRQDCHRHRLHVDRAAHALAPATFQHALQVRLRAVDMARQPGLLQVAGPVGVMMTMSGLAVLNVVLVGVLIRSL